MKPHEVRAELAKRWGELFLAWCRGESGVECLLDGIAWESMHFDRDPSLYTFRRVIPPPEPKRVLRPWTAGELWEHRDWWFRLKGESICQRPVEIDERIVLFDESGVWVNLRDLNRDYECFPPSSGEWQPCGVWVVEGANQGGHGVWRNGVFVYGVE